MLAHSKPSDAFLDAGQTGGPASLDNFGKRQTGNFAANLPSAGKKRTDVHYNGRWHADLLEERRARRDFASRQVFDFCKLGRYAAAIDDRRFCLVIS